ncbi:dual specificity protein phosphatase 19-like [Oncorhynchus tshawytscha]|uniref:Dual specificity protein phosphatase 19 n=1 Tax=Oncorhynchus tshawytscha TaxID=74940 RepID=A0A8C8G097_ONCTS|nr:dual specificity protein phosphatase 19-like [Oncorhynchus tshawytscha]
MHSLAQEIQGFSKTKLKKQSTVVTTVLGRRHIETMDDSNVHENEDPGMSGCGFVQDTSLDLHVGIIKPFLLLSSQDAAQDIDTLKKFKVSHILNVAYGVKNNFPDLFSYKTVTILDIPETDITSYLQECSQFIDQAKTESGVVLVHCNAGVSRAASVLIGYLMYREGLGFDEAFAVVKEARPSIRPNPGFHEQLKNYKP